MVAFLTCECYIFRPKGAGEEMLPYICFRCVLLLGTTFKKFNLAEWSSMQSSQYEMVGCIGGPCRCTVVARTCG